MSENFDLHLESGCAEGGFLDPSGVSAPPSEELVVATVRSGDDPDLHRWIERLKERDGPKRLHAVAVLASLGPRARGALPALIETLKDPAPQVRSLAAVALG